MSAVAQATPSLREIVAEVYEEGKQTRELAEAIAAIATDDQNREAMIQGWQDVVRSYEASQWRVDPRSGHDNTSGRFRNAPSMPNRGILGKRVGLRDGTHYAVAELTAELSAQLKHEYGEQKRALHAGEKFFAELEKELKDSGKQFARDLGEERVEAIRERTGYRV